METEFKLITLDFVSFALTILALIFHNVGFFLPKWWINGNSHLGMWSFTLCEVSCVDKKLLDFEGGKEWLFAVRVFETFGDVFLLIAVVLSILMLTCRRKAVHTALIYVHGAAALFIWVGVFIFLGCFSSLDHKLEGSGSLSYPFAFCFLGGLLCIGASVAAGAALRKHLLEWDDEDDYSQDLVEH